MLISLEEARDESRYGGKAVQLGAATRARLPVPPGFAVTDDEAEQVVGSEEWANKVLGRLGNFVAVRSSAVGEDSDAASFAGMHATVLGVRSPRQLFEAMSQVLASARTEAAASYRKKLGLGSAPRMGIIIQKLVRSEVAGVLFSRHPVSAADERVIEAAWGLGEAVVQGIVTPDRFRMARGGRILERTPGEKDLAIHWSEEGGTREVEVESARVHALCLDDSMLASLETLTARCEAAFGGTHDLEFAFEGEALFLLQRRAITRG